MQITSQLLTKMLLELTCLSGLLLIGVFLRAKIKAFQNLFLPASVIGGFIGLLLGPVVLGKYAILPFPADWIKEFSLLPGQLIIPVITAAPLGMILPSKRDFIKKVSPMFVVLMLGVLMQLAVGTFIGGILAKPMNLYPTFGLELFIGFWGGHGSAGILGNTLKSLNLPYWEVSQGIGTTSATIGLINGIVIGMILINWAARKKYTYSLSEPSDIPEEIKIGYQKDTKKQVSIGKFTVLPESVDVLAFHLSVILGTVGLAFVVHHFIVAYKVPVLSSLNVWIVGLFLMLIVWGIFNKAGIAWIIDRNLVSRITSVIMEYAIVAAIVSIPLKAVMNYLVPMVIMFIIGTILTIVVTVYPLGKKLLPKPWFEAGIAIFGLCSGVFITGLLLLRITDPNFETPVLANFSLAFAINALITWPYFSLAAPMMLSKGPFAFAGLSAALFVVILLVGLMLKSKFCTED